jgi:hypothetical protein
MHTLLFATQRLFAAERTNPGADSANFPSYSAGVARSFAAFGWNAGDLGSSNIAGQSNVLGTHPPR